MTMWIQGSWSRSQPNCLQSNLWLLPKLCWRPQWWRNLVCCEWRLKIIILKQMQNAVARNKLSNYIMNKRFLLTCLWLNSSNGHKSNEGQPTWTTHATYQWKEVLQGWHQMATHFSIIAWYHVYQNNASCKAHQNVVGQLTSSSVE